MSTLALHWFYSRLLHWDTMWMVQLLYHHCKWRDSTINWYILMYILISLGCCWSFCSSCFCHWMCWVCSCGSIDWPITDTPVSHYTCTGTSNNLLLICTCTSMSVYVTLYYTCTGTSNILLLLCTCTSMSVFVGDMHFLDVALCYLEVLVI